MSFTSENGYLPKSIETIMDTFRVAINTQFGTSFTAENFVGSNHYKFFYAAAQEIQSSEVKTSEIFLKAQQYFAITNESIQRPVATAPGIIEALERQGYIASVKQPNNTDAGKIFIAVDLVNTDPLFAAKKLAVATIISNSVALGIPTQGAQVTNIVHSNGQAFDYKFDLPNRITTKLRLTLTLSDSNRTLIGSPESSREILLQNILTKYRLGLDFEPQRYFTTANAPWTSEVHLEWSTDGGTTWSDDVFEANYNDLMVFSILNTEIVEV